LGDGEDKKIKVVPPIKNVRGSTGSSVRAYSVERLELTEGEVVHEEMEQSGGETTGEHSGEIVTVNLYARVAVVGGDYPVLGEDKVERPTGLPSSEIYLH